MASQSTKSSSMYPEVIWSNPNAPSVTSSSSDLYPTIDMKDLVKNLFPESLPESQFQSQSHFPSAPLEATKEVIIVVPNVILNLIDKHYSVKLASDNLTVVHLRQGDNVVAILARVSDKIQWPLAKDEAAVKLDDLHYFFSLRTPNVRGPRLDSSNDDDGRRSKNANDFDNFLNYGLTIASKGQEGLVRELDGILQTYSSFLMQKVTENSAFRCKR